MPLQPHSRLISSVMWSCCVRLDLGVKNTNVVSWWCSGLVVVASQREGSGSLCGVCGFPSLVSFHGLIKLPECVSVNMRAITISRLVD